MQILLACAKTMTDKVPTPPTWSTTPLFQDEANQHIRQLLTYSTHELQQMLKCNEKLAILNQLRYQHFFEEEPSLPAMFSYTGMAYRHLRANDFTPEQCSYANEHLWITSFLYGLLRPMDRIKNYRLEGTARLPENDDRTIFEFWRPRLTDVLIQSVQNDDGILVNNATEEMTHLFDWKRVKEAVTVVEPQFCVRQGKKLKVVTVYAKMCRGAFTRFIIERECQQPDALQAFTFEGYHYAGPVPEGDEHSMLFLLNE